MTKKKQKKNKTKKIILTIIAIVLIVVIGMLLVLNNLSTEKEKLAVTKSLRAEQQELEKEFTSGGYNLENPNIIVDFKNLQEVLVITTTKGEITGTDKTE